MLWMENIGAAIGSNVWQAALSYLLLFFLRKSKKTNPLQTYITGLSLQYLLFASFLYELLQHPQSADAVHLSHLNINTNINIYISNTYIILLIINIAYSILKEQYKKPFIKNEKLEIPSYLQLQFDKLKQQLGIKRDIQLVIQSRIISPFTKGIIKPILLIPISAVNGLNPAQMEAVLLHELWHIKRFDYLFLIIQRAIGKILYFNPFILLISKSIDEDRELSCDLQTIRNSTLSASDYIRSLLVLSRNQQNENTLSTRLNATGNQKSELYNRAIFLLERKKSSKYQGKIWMHIFAIVAFGSSLITMETPRFHSKPLQTIAFIDKITKADNLVEATQNIVIVPPNSPKKENNFQRKNKRKTTKLIDNKSVKNKIQLANRNNNLKELASVQPSEVTKQAEEQLLAETTQAIFLPIAAPEGQKAFFVKTNGKVATAQIMQTLVKSIQRHFPVQAMAYQYASFTRNNTVQEENTTILQSEQYSFLLSKESDDIKIVIKQNDTDNNN